MIKKPSCHNRYSSARQRFLKPVIEDFFARELPRFFGPVLREKIADQLIAIFEGLYPEIGRLKPGQILWKHGDFQLGTKVGSAGVSWLALRPNGLISQ
jgi:hypothetical protein